ncbi:hypothetical protein OC842_005752 [Tilletia horrida]|uniref:Uncharacterized protein n=1 Tax=Tilletia horrida TaxID=155126 RepID=A0AAN6G7E0_9BASI|nr:hypothetical protein OC842_005752 [Tilletia horrida]
MPALILDTADVAAFIRTARPPLDAAGAPLFVEFQRQLLDAITGLKASRLTIAACPDEERSVSNTPTADADLDHSAGKNSATVTATNGAGPTSLSSSAPADPRASEPAMSAWPFSATMDGTFSVPPETSNGDTVGSQPEPTPTQTQAATSLPLLADPSLYDAFQSFFGPTPTLTDVPPSPFDTADHVIDWPVIVALLRGRPGGIMVREIWKLYKAAHAQLPPSGRKFSWSAICAHYRNRCRGSQLISDLSTVVHFRTCPVRAVETDALHQGIRLIDFKTPYYAMRQSPRIWSVDAQDFQ